MTGNFQIVEYYIDEMGKLNHTIDIHVGLANENIVEQSNTLKTIFELLSSTFPVCPASFLATLLLSCL